MAGSGGATVTGSKVVKPLTQSGIGGEVEITGLTQTLPNGTGKSLVVFVLSVSNTSTGAGMRFRVYDNGVVSTGWILQYADVLNQNTVVTIAYIANNSGQDIKVYGQATSGTLSVTSDGTYDSYSVRLGVN